MIQEPQNHVWRFIGQSVRGASHIRDGKPNQDAIDWLPRAEADVGKADGPSCVVEDDLPLVVAISDGHGSERYTHSDRGSRFAVEAAKSILHEFIKARDNTPFQAVHHSAKTDLPGLIVKRWKERVDADIAQESGNEKANRADPERFVAYGATLLAVAITASYVLYLQLGDGDILALAPDDTVYRPLDKDAQLIANETYSLCQTAAKEYFKVEVKPFSALPAARMPSLIMLSTDGYANSFESDEAFQDAARDYWNMARKKDGLEAVRERLEEWLLDTSKEGSGDDITLGIIQRLSADDPEGLPKIVARTHRAALDSYEKVQHMQTEIHHIGQQVRRLSWAIAAYGVLMLPIGYWVGMAYCNGRPNAQVTPHSPGQEIPPQSSTASEPKPGKPEADGKIYRAEYPSFNDPLTNYPVAEPLGTELFSEPEAQLVCPISATPL